MWILVIDDEEDMCWALAKALSQEGYEVRTATGGPEGLALFRAEGADLVLLDIRMPGMSGLEVLERLREADPEVPVLIMTGYSTMETALQAMERGATGYVTKPFNIAEIKETVKKVLSR